MTERKRNGIRFFAALLATALLVCAPLARAQEEPTLESLLLANRRDALYVSPAGSDDADGSEAAPLKTLDAALAAARRYGMDGGTIWLRGGRYALYSTLQIDGGFPSGLNIRAWPGEEPVVVGSDRVADWEWAELCGKQVWAADAPYGALSALYGDDGARQSARWPKEGTLFVASTQPIDGANLTSSALSRWRAFYADPGQIPFDPTGCRVRMLHWWKDECTTVTMYKADSGYLLLNRRTSTTVNAGDRYWLENVLDAPLEAGEWAFDASAHKLYYCPREGETMEDTPLYAGVLTRLLSVSDVDGLTFEGITFAQTGWSYTRGNETSDFAQAAYDAESALVFSSCEGVSFLNCVFRDTGGGCIRMGPRVKSAVVRDCDFLNVGAQAVTIIGNNVRDDERATRDFTLQNNLVAGYGRVFMNAPAFLIIHASHGLVDRNTIRDGFYSAISAGWVWGTAFSATDYLTFTGNLIENVGQGMLSDMGGIYLLGRQNNTVIEGNVIRNVRHAADGYGGRAIFLDEGASGVTVRRNLCYNCSSQAVFQHNGGLNRLVENVFAYCGEGEVGISDSTNEGTIVMERNVLVGSEPTVVVMGSLTEGVLGGYGSVKAGNGKVRQTDSLFYDEAAGSAPFFAPHEGNYSLVIDSRMLAAGFEGFSLNAGCARAELTPGVTEGVYAAFEEVFAQETLPPETSVPVAPTEAIGPAEATPAMPTATPAAEVQVDVWFF